MLDDIRQKINANPELLEKVSKASSISEAVSILKQNGYDVSESDLKSYTETTELSDADLTQVAGGGLYSAVGNTCGSSRDTTDGQYAACNPGDCG